MFAVNLADLVVGFGTHGIDLQFRIEIAERFFPSPWIRGMNQELNRQIEPDAGKIGICLDRLPVGVHSFLPVALRGRHLPHDLKTSCRVRRDFQQAQVQFR